MSNSATRRASAAMCYLDTGIRLRGNLTVATSANVSHLLFDGRRVTGVRAFVDDQERDFLAREVILCAGALQHDRIYQPGRRQLRVDDLHPRDRPRARSQARPRGAGAHRRPRLARILGHDLPGLYRGDGRRGERLCQRDLRLHADADDVRYRRAPADVRRRLHLQQRRHDLQLEFEHRRLLDQR